MPCKLNTIYTNTRRDNRISLYSKFGHRLRRGLRLQWRCNGHACAERTTWQRRLRRRRVLLQSKARVREPHHLPSVRQTDQFDRSAAESVHWRTQSAAIGPFKLFTSVLFQSGAVHESVAGRRRYVLFELYANRERPTDTDWIRGGVSVSQTIAERFAATSFGRMFYGASGCEYTCGFLWKYGGNASFVLFDNIVQEANVTYCGLGTSIQLAMAAVFWSIVYTMAMRLAH